MDGSKWMVARLALVAAERGRKRQGEKEGKREREGGAMVRYMGVTKSIDKERANDPE